MFPHVSTIFNLLSASVFYLWLRPKSTPAAFAANGLVLASFSPLPHQKPLCGMPSPSTCQAKTVEKLGESGRIWENWVWYRSGPWSLCVCAGLHLWSHKSTGLRKSSWIMLDCDRKMNQSKFKQHLVRLKALFFLPLCFDDFMSRYQITLRNPQLLSPPATGACWHLEVAPVHIWKDKVISRHLKALNPALPLPPPLPFMPGGRTFCFGGAANLP